MESELAVIADDGTAHGHRTLAEKAFETLHSAIITGRLRPGARLPIEELAEQLEMSPMPIREALRRLHAAGLVRNTPHRGAMVTELSITDLTEVYEARMALEVVAVRRAAERLTPERETEVRATMSVLHRMSDDNSTATAEAHERFHFTLYAVAESTWLLRLIRPVWETSERYCLEYPQSRQLESRHGEHMEIVDACAVHDRDRAARALRDHLATTANAIAVAMGGGPPYGLATA